MPKIHIRTRQTQRFRAGLMGRVLSRSASQRVRVFDSPREPVLAHSTPPAVLRLDPGFGHAGDRRRPGIIVPDPEGIGLRAALEVDGLSQDQPQPTFAAVLLLQKRVDPVARRDPWGAGCRRWEDAGVVVIVVISRQGGAARSPVFSPNISANDAMERRRRPPGTPVAPGWLGGHNRTQKAAG